MYNYVCMSVHCVYVCVCMHMCVNVFVCVQECVCACMHMRVCVRVCASICVYSVNCNMCMLSLPSRTIEVLTKCTRNPAVLNQFLKVRT